MNIEWWSFLLGAVSSFILICGVLVTAAVTSNREDDLF